MEREEMPQAPLPPPGKVWRDLKRAALILLGCMLGVVLGGISGGVYYDWQRSGGGDFGEIRVAAEMILTGALIGLLSGGAGGYLAGRRLAS